MTPDRASPPCDFGGFAEFGDAVVQSKRIASYIGQRDRHRNARRDSACLLGRTPSGDWYCDLENGAIRVRLDQPQFAPVVLDHRTTDSEP